jgi:hypothetical protein
MPRETEITIQRDQLGGLETAPDLVQVKASINGVVADPIRAGQDFITVKAPSIGAGPWIILLTTPDGKKLLRALDLTCDPEAETFKVKQQEGLGIEEPDADDEDDNVADTIATALGDKVDKAADKIAKAITNAARAWSSKDPA